MDISIVTLPHTKQRYPTVGDWQFFANNRLLSISVSEMNNRDYEFLVALHELIEAYLCYKRNISEEAVTAFDLAFEAKRQENNFDEPGNDPSAPYYMEHQLATHVEKILARQLGVDWDAYDKAVNSLE